MKTYSIAAIARDTGIGKDTLRVWERRYGFPTPIRDAQGERCYTENEMQRLRVVKRLMDAGHRPGRLMAMSAQERQALAHHAPDDPVPTDASAPVAAEGPALPAYLAIVHALDAAGLKRQLSRDAASMGLTRFLTELIGPLSVAVGDAWMRGELAVYEEHMFTSCAQAVLHQALAGLPESARDARPRVLLATLPGEPHGLGLLMAELAFALDAAACLSLGVQTPLPDVVQAAGVFDADIVALSLSGCATPNQALADLRELRGRLPARRTLWVGGSAQALRRRPIEGVQVIDGLDTLPEVLRAWRQAARGG